jgi:hypothetical protein
MKIARVFPRMTKATPVDLLSFVGDPGLFPPEVDEVHVSVTFTYDMSEAERLTRLRNGADFNGHGLGLKSSLAKQLFPLVRRRG